MIDVRKTASALLAVCSLVVSACSGGGGALTTSTQPPQPQAQPTSLAVPNGPVTAGARIGTVPTVPGGWAAPAKITPVDPLPGMFKSVGDTPPAPSAKVRVFFLGMQW